MLQLLLNKNTLLAIMAAGLLFLINNNKDLRTEKKLLKNNFKTVLFKDSLKVAQYEFITDLELENYIKSNQELKHLLSKTDIKTKRIQSILEVKQNYIDSINRNTNVTQIIKDIKSNKPSVAKWEDVSECLIVKGNVTYKNDSLSVNVTDREFNNNSIFIKSKGKRKPIKWLANLRLGTRKIDFTPQSKCGNNKVTIIDKVK